MRYQEAVSKPDTASILINCKTNDESKLLKPHFWPASKPFFTNTSEWTMVWPSFMSIIMIKERGLKMSSFAIHEVVYLFIWFLFIGTNSYPLRSKG